MNWSHPRSTWENTKQWSVGGSERGDSSDRETACLHQKDVLLVACGSSSSKLHPFPPATASSLRLNVCIYLKRNLSSPPALLWGSPAAETIPSSAANQDLCYFKSKTKILSGIGGTWMQTGFCGSHMIVKGVCFPPQKACNPLTFFVDLSAPAKKRVTYPNSGTLFPPIASRILHLLPLPQKPSHNSPYLNKFL